LARSNEKPNARVRKRIMTNDEDDNPTVVAHAILGRDYCDVYGLDSFESSKPRAQRSF
jgi:hypothetical protein